ncbi:MAG: branched-chain amino acid ABC transporter permease [Deltaproteobacteria bacterium]|nr:branched-chain amino acid ABC transporter permease [Deltaproteobacteria bacterium]
MFLQLTVSGLATGCVYALVALGLVLIFKATDRVNFAQGEMAMVSAFLGYTLFTRFHLPVVLSTLGAVALSLPLGWAIERLAVRPALRQPPFNVFIITLGVSIVLRSGAGYVWSHDEFPAPSLFATQGLHLGSVVVTPLNLGTIGVALAIMLALFAFFRFTDLGLAMRAVCERPRTAELMGVDVRRVFSLTWVLSSAITALGGVLIAPILNLSTHMGAIAIPAFAAAILGGWGSIPGAIAGGMLLGVLENLAGGYLFNEIKNMVPFLAVLGILALRPQGLFGEKEIRKV